MPQSLQGNIFCDSGADGSSPVMPQHNHITHPQWKTLLFFFHIFHTCLDFPEGLPQFCQCIHCPPQKHHPSKVSTPQSAQEAVRFPTTCLDLQNHQVLPELSQKKPTVRISPQWGSGQDPPEMLHPCINPAGWDTKAIIPQKT